MMFIPRTIYTRIAFESIIHYFHQGNLNHLKLVNVPDELYEIRRGCFVSLHKRGGELRGCIGTIEPCEKNLVEEIKRNAISAAINDSRFPPLDLEEVEQIIISVDVLTPPERVYHPDDLDSSVYGLILSDGKYRRGILLPGIESVNTVQRQINIVRQKAGLEQEPLEKLLMFRFTTNRYH